MKDPNWDRKQTILYAISLLDGLMETCKTTKLFKWCAHQKEELQEVYAKINK